MFFSQTENMCFKWTQGTSNAQNVYTCCQKLVHSLVSRALRKKICPDMAICSATGRKVTPLSPVSPSLQSMGSFRIFQDNADPFLFQWVAKFWKIAPNGSFDTSDLDRLESSRASKQFDCLMCLRIFAWWQLWQDKRTCDNGDFVHLLHPNGAVTGVMLKAEAKLWICRDAVVDSYWF